ncbi:MAG: outer membrane lipid asymmetry maintenance protein MlaD [Betaproteobacteria bacterium]|nr:outer membrane lipid asymmetry maintenance protein MlaD [Betaproteobacteria bacterium]
MNRTVLDFWVGLFVAIGIASLLFLALKVGNLGSFSPSQTYVLKAAFDNIGGLKVRGAVKSAGVVVGRVSSIEFDPKTYEAVVSMEIDTHYRFPRDSSLSILTSGLLGEQYIGVDAGIDDQQNLDGSQLVTRTNSAVVLEKLISQFLFDKAAEPPAPKP